MNQDLQDEKEPGLKVIRRRKDEGKRSTQSLRWGRAWGRDLMRVCEVRGQVA